MGCCAAGMSYVGVGRDHWYEMLENPRKPVAQWYQLQESVPGMDNTPNGKQLRSCIKWLGKTTLWLAESLTWIHWKGHSRSFVKLVDRT